VVKDQLKLFASAFPAKSLTPEAPPVMVAVYVADATNDEDGVSVIWLPEVLTVAVTRVPAAFLSWNVVPVTVDALTDSLKFATTVVLVLIPVAPLAGATDETVGGVLSTAAVVKLQLKLFANAFPARSLTPELPPTIVAV